MLRSYKFGSRRFDTFSTKQFFCLARSCRVIEKFDKNHRFFVIFCRSGPEKRSIGSDFSATRYDLGKQKSTHLANVLKFMLASLQRLGPSERRVVLSQRSDFAEKQHNLALGSTKSIITEPQMVPEVWESKVRCVVAISITKWCHGGIGVDENSTGPEKAERAREKAACWHYQHNLMLQALGKKKSLKLSQTHFLR